MFTHLAKKVVFVPSAVGLSSFVNEPEQSLPSSTLAVDSEVKAIFDKVQQISNRGVKDVILRVATTSLQVISAKHYQMMGATSPLTDLYHISRIEEVTLAVDGNIVVKFVTRSFLLFGNLTPHSADTTGADPSLWRSGRPRVSRLLKL